MNDDKALDILIKGILKSINSKLRLANFNKGITGRITSVIDNNKYSALINGKEYIVKSRFELNVNDIVKIVIFNNDYNELYVIY